MRYVWVSAQLGQQSTPFGKRNIVLKGRTLNLGRKAEKRLRKKQQESKR